LTEPYGEEAGNVWTRSRLRDRIDAIIIHELAESQEGTHEAALAAAPNTERLITEGTRRILHAMEQGSKSR
jgi:hypothetical protein